MHVDNSYNHGVGELRLSLIIPIYNGRSYIASLVREIMAQNVTGIEVIFVDDGSLDDSAAVIELEITRTDTDGGITWQLIREQNRGQGGARNAGLAAARGAWVMFCDQDDHIRDNYLRTMLETAEAAGCDILISGYDMVREDGRVIRHASLENTSWSRFMNVTPWGKVYRTSFLRKHGICFYESPYGEDVYFMLMCEAAQANVRITSYVGYAWVQHATSVSHTAHRLLDRESSALSLIHKASMEIAGLDLQDPELRYFYIKTAIYHETDPIS